MPPEGTKMELMLTVQGYVYFKTNARTVKDAMQAFYNTANSAEINIDNLVPGTAVLRDDDGNDVDTNVFHDI